MTPKKKKNFHYGLSALPRQESQYNLDIVIVQILLKILDENNVLVKKFRMSRDRFKEFDMHNCFQLLSIAFKESCLNHSFKDAIC